MFIKQINPMNFYSLCESELKETESAIEELIGKREKKVFGIITPFIKKGGKRFRPLLFFLSFYAFGGRKSKQVLQLAALIEMFHNFTLIHDDIEDDSKFRRGEPTLHIAHGVPMALNSGDALYTLIWKLFAEIEFPQDRKLKIMRLCADAFLEVVEGQGIEIFWEKEKLFDITEHDYYNMINKKTAALIALSCKLGAYLAGADEEEQDAFEKFGRNIGIAFQVCDDVLNLTADFKKYQKEIGGDITEGKRSLAVIKALEAAPQAERKRLMDILSKHTGKKEEIEEAISIIRKFGGIAYSIDRSKKLVDEAKKAIAFLKPSQYKDALLSLADYTLTRES